MSEVATINNVEFAKSAAALQGTLPIAALDRLAELLVSREGNLRYELKGFIGKDGQPYLKLRLLGTLQVVCQICLEAMEQQLDVETAVLVDTGNFTPAEAEDGELPDMIDADEQMVVQDFIEDEVILALPMVPRHESGACGSVQPQAMQQQATDNPFAKLAALKSQTKKTD